jgi:hypothetical protein
LGKISFNIIHVWDRLRTAMCEFAHQLQYNLRHTICNGFSFDAMQLDSGD